VGKTYDAVVVEEEGEGYETYCSAPAINNATKVTFRLTITGANMRPVPPHLASGTLFISSSSLRRRDYAPTFGASTFSAHGAGSWTPAFTAFRSGKGSCTNQARANKPFAVEPT